MPEPSVDIGRTPEEHPGVQEEPNVEEHRHIEEKPGVQQEEQHNSNITRDEDSCCWSSFCCLKRQGDNVNVEPYCSSSALTSSRDLLLSSPVELKRGLQKQDHHLFLYEDILIITKIQYNNTYQIQYKVRLSDMWISTCTEDGVDRNRHNVKSFMFGWPLVNFVATFRSAEEKEIWLLMLQSYINIEKEKDFPKVLSVKIFTKDIDNCAKFKTLTVKNSETVVEIINTSLSELGLTGKAKDFELWVHTGKLASPYLLLGHENPYAIQMSHVRSKVRIMVPKTEDITFIQKKVFTKKHLKPGSRCQFILKPTRRTPALTKNDAGHRNVLRRRSVLNWTFWRRPNTELENGLGSPLPTSSVTGNLFGISWPPICENGNLPTNILVSPGLSCPTNCPWRQNMLWVLYERGPLTEGIFRRSASVKACRKLKEKLNAAADVQMYCEPLFVVASVFKDFLRSIPGSLLSSNMFEIWLSIMDEVNHEERIRTIRLLLRQLPRANTTVLKYLFGVLHCIEQNSSLNRMNAHNLAICIAPSILWPPPDSQEVENEYFPKMSKLIQFFIENCGEIFGQEIFSLFGEVSKESRENIPDPLQNEDESLENEDPYGIWGYSCNIQKLGVKSRSLPSFTDSSARRQRRHQQRCQRHSSAPTLSTETSLKESFPQESPVGATLANAVLFESPHHAHHARDSSGGNLFRSWIGRTKAKLKNWWRKKEARTIILEENSTLREASGCPKCRTSQAAQEAHCGL